ncbi:hypothetical protein B0H10DRAFT_2238500 [Mycena sp. CBHHK59/15]|nr:hypothetical protein B0H10DRAFT_2238500 [Mycena sp. CBHHK59/15]
MSELHRHQSFTQTESSLTPAEVKDIASEAAQEICENSALQRLRRLKEKVRYMASQKDVETLEASLREICDKWDERLSLVKTSANQSIERLKGQLNQLELDKPVQAREYAKLQAEISSVGAAASLDIQNLINAISARLEQVQSAQSEDRSTIVFFQQELELMKADVERIYSSLSVDANRLQEKNIVCDFCSQLSENATGLATAEDRPSLAAEMEPGLHEDPRNLSDLENQVWAVVPDDISDIKEAEPESEGCLQLVVFEPRQQLGPFSVVDAIPHALADIEEAEPKYEDSLQLTVFEPRKELRLTSGVDAIPSALAEPEDEDGLQVIVFEPQAATGLFALGLLLLALWIEVQKAGMEAHYEW